MTQPAAKAVTATHPTTVTGSNNQNRFPGAQKVPPPLRTLTVCRKEFLTTERELKMSKISVLMLKSKVSETCGSHM